MRLKVEAILDFGPNGDQNENKIVRQYREQYKAISKIIDCHSRILDMTHHDLGKLSKATSRRGRKAEFSSENLLRAIIVMQLEGLDYREASLRIGESETLQNFCRLRRKRTINFTLLNKAFAAIRPETWEMMNQSLALGAVAEEAVSLAHVRTDTTVTECNIHWPIDSSLLWDSYRVIAREMSRAREYDSLSCPWRFTDYVVLEKNRSDEELLPLVINQHEEKYGRRPQSVAADKGFCPNVDTYEELQEQVDYMGVPRRSRDFGDMLMSVWRQWRAGIEGTISCLKRAFRLARCCFRGFKNFASAVGSAVFCHNLRILAKTSGG